MRGIAGMLGIRSRVEFCPSATGNCANRKPVSPFVRKNMIWITRIVTREAPIRRSEAPRQRCSTGHGNFGRTPGRMDKIYAAATVIDGR